MSHPVEVYFIYVGQMPMLADHLTVHAHCVLRWDEVFYFLGIGHASIKFPVRNFDV